jgi:predicted DCC family thiol-disulfide oxidoreductase YuxK
MPLPDRILFYDGECGLCNRSVQRILRNERDHRNHFATLQGALAARALPALGIDPEVRDTVVFLLDGDTEKSVVLTKSRAVFEIARHMTWIHRLVRMGRLLPTRWMDALYNWVAAHRMTWFPPVDQCSLMKPEQRSRFLD